MGEDQQATGVVPQDLGGGPSPVSSPAAEGATGGQTPGAASAPAPVPYDVFSTAQRERTELKGQLERFSPYQSLIDHLGTAGVTAEEALNLMLAGVDRGQQPAGQPVQQQYQGQQTEGQQYWLWLQQNGVNPDEVGENDALNRAFYGQFRMAQQLEHDRAEQQQWRNTWEERHRYDEARRLDAMLAHDMGRIRAAFPMLAGRPELEKAVFALVPNAFQAGTDPVEALRGFFGELDALVRDATAKYAVTKQDQQQAAAPFANGGVAPAPAPQQTNLFNMPESQRKEHVLETLRALTAAQP